MTSSAARRALRALWESVEVVSCADGTFRVEPRWRDPAAAGVCTRLFVARRVGDVLGLPRRHVLGLRRKEGR